MRPVLVKVDVAASTLELSADEMYEMADGASLIHGRLVWVFDFASREARDGREGGKRDLRFWLGELWNRSNGDRYTLDEALAFILPTTIANWSPGRVCGEFQIRDNTLMKLRGEIGQPQGMIPRAKLAQFLKHRWLGSAIHIPQLSKFNPQPKAVA